MLRKGIVLLNLFFSSFAFLSLADIKTPDVSIEMHQEELQTNQEMAVDEIEGDYVKDRLLIKYQKPIIQNMSSKDIFSSAFVISYEELNTDALMKDKLYSIGGSETVWYKADLIEGTDIDQAIYEAMKIPGVLYAEPDYVRELQVDGDPVILNQTELSSEADLLTDDELLSSQYYLDKVNISEARDFLESNSINPGGSREVIVAVIDTGVDYNHPELAPNMWINPNEEEDGQDNSGNGVVDDIHGISVIGNEWSHHGDPMDLNGHGTHVAGIIAAKGNNQLGIRGVADNVRIMAIQAAGSFGIFNTSDIVEAINYAVENGADVINMSFGGYTKSRLEMEALELAFNHAVLVAAAGNDGYKNIPGPMGVDLYPAAHPFVIGVMASTPSDIMATFTNYDFKPQDSHEYEIVAPGSGIISTLPNEEYAIWDGTSMSAPIISGIAALLKSYYNDPSSHSSRFIMGQLIGTADHPIQKHLMMMTMHSEFYQANAYQAFVSTPKPELTQYEYYIFDDESVHINNNGNGVIDAGETINLALLIRNHWGKASDVNVTIDTDTVGGLSDPYINIVQDTINYGDVGTFSTKDNGLTYDENSKITHVEHPFVLEVDPDTPNDYHIILNITVEGRNGLDLEDENIYNNFGCSGRPQQIHLTIRNGQALPTVIEEDMTLTNDTFWIIPNGTIIPEGVTVNVEEGTSIQFWSNEPEDVYADKTLAYLKVEGEFNVEGSLENPVKMFPSDLKAEFPVMIFSGDFNGSSPLYQGFQANDKINISYAEIVNPNIGANIIDHVKFTQNYNYMLHRWIDNGEIQQREWYSTRVNANYISSSIFSKLGSTETYLFCCAVDRFKVSGILEGNLFDSVYMEPNAEIAENNVFLNNYILEEAQWDDLMVYTSVSSNLGRAVSIDDMFRNYTIQRNNETGTTYIKFEMRNTHYRYPPVEVANALAESLGGHMVSINSKEEENYLRNHFVGHYFIGLRFNPKVGYEWMSGEPVDYVNWSQEDYNYTYHQYVTMNWDGTWRIGNTPSEYMIEIPGEVLLEDFNVLEDTINLSEQSDPYMIPVSLVPETVDKNQLTFTSSDELVATVSSDGVVTPISIGQATITITNYSETITKTVTVNVTEYVGLDDFTISSDVDVIEAGMVKRITSTFLPLNTTERKLIWSSSDESVAKVDSFGNITALSPGQVIISASTPDGNINKSLSFNVIQYADTIEFNDSFIVLLDDETYQLNPIIEPVDATHKEVTYESSNPLVASVDENGIITAISKGTVVIRATLLDKEAYAEIIVNVSDEVLDTYNVKQVVSTSNSNDTRFYALMDDGTVWSWGQGDILPKQLSLTNIQYMDTHDYRIIMFDANDNIYYLDHMSSQLEFNQKTTLSNIKKVAVGSSYYLVLTEDGSVWGWGDNYDGQLGASQYGEWINQELQLDIDGVVKDIVATNSTSYFLMDDGSVMAVGYTWNGDVTEPIAIDGISNVKAIYRRGYSELTVLTESGSLLSTSINQDTNTYTTYNNVIDYSYGENHELILLSDGTVLSKGDNTFGELGLGHFDRQYDFQVISSNEIITSIHAGRYVSALRSEDGNIFVFGRNHQGQLADLTNDNSYSPKQVYFGLESDETPLTLLSSNPDDGDNYVSRDQVIEITFNQAIKPSENFAYIRLVDSQDKYVSINRYIELNRLYIQPTVELLAEENYRLEISYNSLISLFGQSNSEIILDFITEPGELYVKNITLASDAITISNNNQPYQIDYTIDPIMCDETYIEWTSADESIVTVDEFGVLTPVSEGQTTITVSDLPGTVIKTITVDVVPYKAITYYEITDLDKEMFVGDVELIEVDYLPVDTTEKQLIYDIADDGIISVDSYGFITALTGGQTTITVSSPSLDVNYTISVKVNETISQIEFDDDFYVTSVNVDDSFILPSIYPETATETEINYVSSNPDIAYVNDLGELVKLDTGIIVIRAEAVVGDAYDEIIVSIDDYESFDTVTIVDSVVLNNDESVASLTADGHVWVHGYASDDRTPRLIDIEKIIEIDSGGRRLVMLGESGTVYYMNHYYYDSNDQIQITFAEITSIPNVTRISASEHHVLMLTDDQKLYGYGYNYNGLMGIINLDTWITSPLELVQFDDILDFSVTDNNTYVLSSNNKLLVLGGLDDNNEPITTPIEVEGIQVEEILYHLFNRLYVRDINQDVYAIRGQNVTMIDDSDIEGELFSAYYTNFILDESGDVYAKGDNYNYQLGLEQKTTYNTYTKVDGLENIVKIIPFNNLTLFINDQGNLFLAGENNHNLHLLFSGNVSVKGVSKIPYGLLDDRSMMTIENSYPQENDDSFAIDEKIVIEFSKILKAGDYLPYVRLSDENGVYVDIKREIKMNQLIITPSTNLMYDMDYQLEIPSYAVKDLYGESNNPMNLSFRTQPEVLYVRDIIIHEEDIYLRNSSDITEHIQFTLSPSILDNSFVDFVSSDINVVTVDDNGLLIPQGIGNATVTISSTDGSIIRSVNVYVSEYIELESFEFETDALTAMVGQVKRVPVTFTPFNSTEKELSYTSSDESIATVDDGGFITFLTGGTVTITATDSTNTLVDTVSITVEEPVDEVLFESNLMLVTMTDQINIMPSVYPETASNKSVIFESSDETVAFVDELGNLNLVGEGIVVIRATAETSEAYDEVIISVSDESFDNLQVVDVTTSKFGNELYSLALMDDGSVWYWNSSTTFPIKLPYDNIIKIDAGRDVSFMLLDNNGKVYYSRTEDLYFDVYTQVPDVVDISAGPNHALMLTETGDIWGVGSSGYGRLGNITSGHWFGSPIQINGFSNVKQVEATYNGTYILMDDGLLQYIGHGYNQNYYQPKTIDGLDPVEMIYESNRDSYIIVKTINQEFFKINHTYGNDSMVLESIVTSSVYEVNGDYFLIDANGKLWVRGQNNSFSLGLGHDDYLGNYQKHEFFDTVTNVHSQDDTTYVIDGQGQLFAFGSNISNQIGSIYPNMIEEPLQIFFGMQNDDRPIEIRDTYPIHNETYVNLDETIKVTFNKAIYQNDSFYYIQLKDSSGQFISTQIELRLNELYITPSKALDYDTRYILSIPENALVDAFSNSNAALNLSFETRPEVLTLEDIIIHDRDIRITNEISTYQIDYDLLPSIFDNSQIVIESSNLDVASVDVNGLLTINGLGQTTITFKSIDNSIIKTVDVEIIEKIDLLDFSIAPMNQDIYTGYVYPIELVLDPIDTTQLDFTYESSNPLVATVDNSGIITALSNGQTTITITNGNISRSIDITVQTKLESIEFAERIYVTDTNADPQSLTVSINPSNASAVDINYVSSNEDIAYFNDLNELVVLQAGNIVVRAEFKGDTSIYDEMIVSIHENTLSDVYPVSIHATRHSRDNNSVFIALMSDGSLRTWGYKNPVPVILDFPESISKITMDNHDLILLGESGTIYYGSSNSLVNGHSLNTVTTLKDVIDVTNGQNHYLALDASGNVWGFGHNNNACLGVGEDTYIQSPLLLYGGGDAIDISANRYRSIILTQDGQVLIFGHDRVEAQIIEGLPSIVGLREVSPHEAVLYAENGDIYIINDSSNLDIENVSENMRNRGYDIIDYTGRFSGSFRMYLLRDGRVVTYGSNDYLKRGFGDQEPPQYSYVHGLDNVNMIYASGANGMVLTDDHRVLVWGNNADNQLSNGELAHSGYPHEINLNVYKTETLTLLEQYPLNETINFGVGESFTFKFDQPIIYGDNFNNIVLTDIDGYIVPIEKTLEMTSLVIKPLINLDYNKQYNLSVSDRAISNLFGDSNDQINISVTTSDSGQIQGIGTQIWTEELLDIAVDSFFENAYHSGIHHNAILNNITIPETDMWMRFISQSGDEVRYLNYNYWGTIDEELIGKQIRDYEDYPDLQKIEYAPFLTKDDLETMYPFVVDAYAIDESMDKTYQIGIGEQDFIVEFNRDMDINSPLNVYFGPDYPYTDYKIEGVWLDARTWKGNFNITPLTGDGRQFFRIRDAKAADDAWLEVGDDEARFVFEIRTASAESMNLHASSAEGRIILSWLQDDFDLLAGYNIYRSNSIDGNYSKINSTVISNSNKEYSDYLVEPGQIYYYKFTVVKTDLTESDYSNIVASSAYDTIAPSLYHKAITETNLGVDVGFNITAFDNIGIESATLYYRVAGDSDYMTLDFIAGANNKYNTQLFVTGDFLAGIEYYIEVSDSFDTVSDGSAEFPHVINVHDYPSLESVSPAYGDVNENTLVTITGSNFKDGAKVFFGDYEGLEVEFVNENTLRVLTPQNIPSSVNVKVVNPTGDEDILINAYEYRGNEVSLQINNARGYLDQEVVIPIEVKNVNGLLSADFTVNFDTNNLMFISHSKGDIATRFTTVINDQVSGQLRISMASDIHVSGSGTIIKLRFKVVGDMESDLTLSNVSLNGGAIDTTEIGGQFIIDYVYTVSGQIRYFMNQTPVNQVKISLNGIENFTVFSGESGEYDLLQVEPGDYSVTYEKYDETESISAYDAAMILRFSAGLDGLDEYQVLAGDVNNDGSVNSFDAGLILQFVSGLSSLPFNGRDEVWTFVSGENEIVDLSNNINLSDVTAVLIGDVSGNYQSSTAQVEREGLINISDIVVEGNIISTPVHIRTLRDDIYAIETTINYNPSLKIKEIIINEALNDYMVVVNTNNPGQIKLVIAGANSIGQLDNIFEVIYEKTSDDIQKYSFTIENTLFNESTNILEVDYVYNQVQSFDINMDGQVNGDDLDSLVNMLNTSFRQVDISIFDYNHDGIIDVYDILIHKNQ